jgi:hypothetical protein
MNRARFSARALAAAVLFNALALAGAARAADGKCTVATKGSSPAAQACAKGGRAEAKKAMKDMVRKAQEHGQKFTCDGCHKDLETFDLTANARDDFKKLEAAQTK